MNNIPYVDENSFKIDVEDFDAISFFRMRGKKGEMLIDSDYIFNIMKFENPKNDFMKDEMGYKFIMLTEEKNSRQLIQDEAILGDPIHILLNYVKSGSQGFFIKRCNIAEKLVNSIKYKFALQECIELIKDKLKIKK